MKTRLALLTGALLLSASSLASHAEDSGSNVLFIFDSSGSMKKPIASGESRADAAKRAMVAALSEMPPGANLGLLMYGHRRAKDCSDIEMVFPLGASDSKGIAQAILKSEPKGETPIAAALESAASSFAPLAGQSNSIVLVTDGAEECDGDPCAAARAIRDAGTGLKAHVVGFTLNEKQRQTVQCIADETGGKYFDAQDSDGLTGALAEVQKAVVEVPAKPARERVFFDDFDGADLAEHWVVTNPNPDGYIVESGKLLMVNSAVGGFNKVDSANIIQLERDLPNGDWDIHVTFTGEFKTIKDIFWVGLRADENNYMAASIWCDTFCCYDTRINVSMVKRSDGVATGFEKKVYDINKDKGSVAAYSNRIKLTLSKRARDYSATYVAEGEEDAEGKQIVHKTDSLTSLRPPGKLALSVSKHAEAPGEFLVNIDSVEIETVMASP